MRRLKIFYAVQATGNGHISRAIELLPYLKEFGGIDVFLSGSNAALRPDLPVKFRSQGLSLFYRKDGKLNKWKIIKQLNPIRLIREALKLPLQEYDLILVDYEFITSLACRIRKIPFWHIGHQASFVSPWTPRPQRRDNFAEWVLRNYSKSNHNIGFHFDPYEDWILPPIIKSHLWELSPTTGKHYTIYLPHYSKDEIRRSFYGMEGFTFEVFTKEVDSEQQEYNLKWKPIDNEAFTQSLVSCRGVITGAGFETPAEALFLKKPMIVIPIQGQYEQYCNAAALESFGVLVVNRLDINFTLILSKWAKKDHRYTKTPDFLHTEEAVKSFMDRILY